MFVANVDPKRTDDVVTKVMCTFSRRERQARLHIGNDALMKPTNHSSYDPGCIVRIFWKCMSRSSIGFQGGGASCRIQHRHLDAEV